MGIFLCPLEVMLSKISYPLWEPRPAYMSSIGMLSARYIDGPGTPAGDPPVVPAVAPVVPPAPAVPPVVPPVDVAALQAQLATYEAAEVVRAQEAQAKVDAELSDLQKAQRTIAELTINSARADALVAHPVPEKYRSLVQGTDAASFLASAKLASELAAAAEGKTPPAAPLQPVPHAGTTPDGGQPPTGGSVQAGRDLYTSKNPKN